MHIEIKCFDFIAPIFVTFIRFKFMFLDFIHEAPNYGVFFALFNEQPFYLSWRKLSW